ncbi:MAG: hypothetical protein Q9225_000277 [Loekoesia sp. 1 TL-2023]
MAVHSNFNRRLRATKYESDDEDLGLTDSELSTNQALDVAEDLETSSDETNSESELDGDSGASSSSENLADISFGALAKAQGSLGKRKRGHEEVTINPDRMSPTRDIGNPEAAERKAGRNDTQEHACSSKHAPAEMSSKKAVSRKREVIPTIKRDIRDPRFEPTSGPLNHEKAQKNYSFLNEYRDSEIVELKSTVRQTKDPIAKEKLKRALLRMESRKKTQELKDQEQEVLRAHRSKEKELIKQGKKPFYLKKAEQKKLALVHRFEGMKDKQVDKIIERRRKKKASREKRVMPEGRRTLDG